MLVRSIGIRDISVIKRVSIKKVLSVLVNSNRTDSICTDKWDSFIAVFEKDNHILDKASTVGIKGNNCRLRHRIRRAFRKTCRLSKKLFNHFKAFDLAFFISILGLCKSILL